MSDEAAPVLDLNEIQPPGKVPAVDPDERTRTEKSAYDKARNRALLADLTRKVRDRRAYTSRLFWLMVVWMIAVFGIIIATGVKKPISPPATNIAWPWWSWLSVLIVLTVTAFGAWWPCTCAAKSQKNPKGIVSNTKWPWWVTFGIAAAGLVAASIVTAITTACICSGAEPSRPGWPLWEWVVAFELPEAVLLALIGGTTANVIGLFLIVARHLFPGKDDHD